MKDRHLNLTNLRLPSLRGVFQYPLHCPSPIDGDVKMLLKDKVAIITGGAGQSPSSTLNAPTRKRRLSSWAKATSASLQTSPTENPVRPPRKLCCGPSAASMCL
jgi:hypothetical protein